MDFYQVKDEIAQELTVHLQSVLRQKGLITQDVMNQYKAILAGFKDRYSYSLLMKDTPKEDAPTFSNVPTTIITFEVRDRFEEIFEALGLPTTQAAAYSFAQKLRRGSIGNVLTDTQKDKLEKLPFFADRCEKISNWLVRARAIVVTMGSNTALAQMATEEEKAFASKLDFDWYYDYSDDQNVWRGGRANHDQVIAYVKKVLTEKPHFLKVVETLAHAAGLRVSFFTGNC
jgi:hypothetical protein